jgi:predicted transposase/invertase (TIGR01784 family)
MPKELLSLKNDAVFKLTFGAADNISLLTAFLKSVLDLPAAEYDHLVLVDPHLQREFPDDKMGILDVKIHTTTGKVIDVEIQVESQTDMWERILFYTARLTTEQLRSGLDYKLVKKAISIVILDWNLTEKQSHYHHRFRLHDEKNNYRFPDLFEINTLELPKLPVEPDGTEIYNWLRLFTATTREELEMVAKTSPEIAKTASVIMELSEDERTRMLAESQEKYRRDEFSRRKKAYLDGRQEERLALVGNMFRLKMSPEAIAETTGLSLEEVKALAAELPPEH